MILDQRGQPIIKVYSGGYSAAGRESSSMARWMPFAGSADSDTSRALPDLRARSRDLNRNNGLARGGIATIVERTVGTGLAMHPRPNNQVLKWSDKQLAEFKEAAAAEFSLMADSTHMDVANELTFYQRQAVLVEAVLESGDCLSIVRRRQDPNVPYSLRLQMVEADRLGNPFGKMDTDEMTAGVEFDPESGRRKRYHVYHRHPGSLVMGSRSRRLDGVWVDAYTPRGTPLVLHHLRIRRPEQKRGVPHLAPVIELLKQLGRYTEAEIMAAVVTSMLTVFVKSPAPESNPLMGGQNPAAAKQYGDVSLKAGAIVGLPPGDEIQEVDPSRPNPAFDPFWQAIVRQIGIGLELPYEVLIKHFQASYSASRASLLEAWQFIRGRREWLRLSYCQPVYELLLEEAIALGRIRAPGFFDDPLIRAAVCRADWTGDSMGSLNPKDEVAAAVSAINARLTTRQRAEMELFGTDFDATLDQKREEQQALRDADLLPEPSPGAAANPGAMPAPGREKPGDREGADDESELDEETE